MLFRTRKVEKEKHQRRHKMKTWQIIVSISFIIMIMLAFYGAATLDNKLAPKPFPSTDSEVTLKYLGYNDYELASTEDVINRLTKRVIYLEEKIIKEDIR